MNNDSARSILVIEPGFEGPLSPNGPYRAALEQFVDHLHPKIIRLLNDCRIKIRGVSPHNEAVDHRDSINVTAGPLLVHNVLRGIGRVHDIIGSPFFNDFHRYSDNTNFRNSLGKDCPNLDLEHINQIAPGAFVDAFANLYASANGGNRSAMILGRSAREFPTALRWVADNTTPALNPASRRERTVEGKTYPAKLRSFADIILHTSGAMPGVPALSPRPALAAMAGRRSAPALHGQPA